MRRSRITVAGVVVLAVASTTGAATAPGTGDAAAIHAAPTCIPAGSVRQTMNGRITACVRVGNLAPGARVVALQDLLNVPSVGRPGPPKPVGPAQPWVRLTVSPAAGPPGTAVTVTGHLRRSLGAHDSHPNVCWDGCGGGFGYGDVTMRWSSPRAFHTRIVVPDAPWIAGEPARVVPLVTGDYKVAITCLREAIDCGAAPGPTATFHLTVARPVAWCRTPPGCAALRVTPARIRPGEVLRVTGFAPLVQGNLPATGTTYDMVVLRRRRHMPQVRFGRDGGEPAATVGHGAVRVVTAPHYHAVAPLGQVSDGVPQISADPADPGTVAWCDAQTIAVSGPGGTTPIPSATAKPVLQAMGFSFRFDPTPECAAVAPLTSTSGAPAGLAAAFMVTESEGPPFYLAALVTHDDGRTWAPISVPRGSGPAGFGGFRYRADGTLQAVFARSLKGPIDDFPVFDSNRVVTEVSSADAHSFSQAPLGCPSVGPCVTFGAFAPGNCAMNGTMQAVLRSTDGGARWSAPDFPSPVQACDTAELVATSAAGALLVDSTSTYPVLRTTDGGATWHDVALPRRGGNGNLVMLPDGSLLMAGGEVYAGPWRLLRRGRRAWCVLRVPPRMPTSQFPLTPPTVVDGRLWWLTGSLKSATAAPVVHALPLSALRC